MWPFSGKYPFVDVDMFLSILLTPVDARDILKSEPFHHSVILPFSVCDIKNKDESEDVSVKGCRQTTVPLLTSSVPNLRNIKYKNLTIMLMTQNVDSNPGQKSNLAIIVIRYKVY